MGTKRQAREIALQVLYPVDMTELSVDEALARFFDNFDAEPKARVRAEEIVRGVHANRARIDEVLAQASPRWRLERMALVDRNLLRLCAHELLFDLDTPARVVIDEGVDIAKRFGAEESARFVNGVLDAAARALGRLGDGGSDP
ncbi:MAG: transcription antitermination factor NusB [Deltaproteobacteria bacterium]|nr:transcription antitermination factor NusB [Deltaproteobacteria bacterium]